MDDEIKELENDEECPIEYDDFMYKALKIDGWVIIPKKLSNNDFTDKFIEFIEKENSFSMCFFKEKIRKENE